MLVIGYICALALAFGWLSAIIQWGYRAIYDYRSFRRSTAIMSDWK